MRSTSFPRRQYTASERREALALARRLGTVSAAASQLGIPPHTIYCWRDVERGRRPGKPAAFEPVEILAGGDATGDGVTVHGPVGLRLDGLSLDQVAQLWRLLA